MKERFEAKVERIPFSECHWWTASTNGGYGQIGMPGNRPLLAHRAAYELYVGEIPEGMFVCHKCDNKLCVNPDHLFLGSHRDNMADMTSKGRQNKGEKNGSSKLREQEVLEIFRADGSQREIAERYSVCQQTVWGIKTGSKWGWLTGAAK